MNLELEELRNASYERCVSNAKSPLHGSCMVSLPQVWRDVLAVLSVKPQQAVEFVESMLRLHEYVLYAENARTGLFEPAGWNISERTSTDVRNGYLMDAWNGAQSMDWNLGAVEKWDFLRLQADEADLIVQLARATLHLGDIAPAASAPDTPQAWPWGAHETELLRHLAAAASRWWANFDPNDATTAPTNDAVSAWLQERGVSKSLSDKMATILRADDLPPGPRT